MTSSKEWIEAIRKSSRGRRPQKRPKSTPNKAYCKILEGRRRKMIRNLETSTLHRNVRNHRIKQRQKAKVGGGRRGDRTIIGLGSSVLTL